ncbi:MAG: bifunctional diaminohydroxyphosphoribosylaminopyrimidine deaminase/5-amino-6-(5-phosphoribosylamino)uracil reductase RibD [Actinomycetota bacterium]|nr:bifunctional diaminohydroxyphosphoribosylaminopyrimidine deaminase/5-amino-6-(5-phosphoribosylamino)uracil reductase RibD [Actinomycetota bacterium]
MQQHTHDAVAWMRAALELAARGPLVDANPLVGAVLVDEGGRPVGTGWHAGAGSAHAEVMALAEAGGAARGATAYVTLEPCSHTGRTPPCSQALLDAGVSRVVFAQTDPNPKAAGGADVLRAAGVEVEGGLLAGEAQALNEAWTFAQAHARPMVTWKLATTLDGRAAAADGTSRWITGPQARADVHELRARCGAVVVGTGTALADDPSLTARRPDGTLHAVQPLRVVVGDRPLPPDARLLDDSAPTLRLPRSDTTHVLQELTDREIHHVLLEGGPTLAAAFVQAGLVDEVVAYVAPVLLGAGAGSVGDLGIRTISDAVRLDLRQIAQLGPDLRLRAVLRSTVPDPTPDLKETS